MRAITAILPVAVAAIAAAQQVTIRVPVHLVALRTLVFSRENRLLPSLEPADFQVSDNGRPQRFTLESTLEPVSVVLAIQSNPDVRAYARFIAKTGSAVDALLSGATGESAILSYGSDINVLKTFDKTEDAGTALRKLEPAGRQSRMLDAASRAITLLAGRPRRRQRVLVLIGQPADNGSESGLDSIRRAADRERIQVFALTLPLLGRAFVSDTFSLGGPTAQERGGFRAGADLGKLVAVLTRSAKAETAADPFSLLTAATGGAELHFRTQRELEDGLAAIGVQLRSGYVLSYSPDPADEGYHSVRVDVTAAGAKVYTRPGYWLASE